MIDNSTQIHNRRRPSLLRPLGYHSSRILRHTLSCIASPKKALYNIKYSAYNLVDGLSAGWQSSKEEQQEQEYIETKKREERKQIFSAIRTLFSGMTTKA